MEGNLVKAFLSFLKVSHGLGKDIFTSGNIILVFVIKSFKVYLRDKSLASINLVLQVQLLFPKASFCMTNTKEYLCTFVVPHVGQGPKPMLKVFCFIWRDKNQVYLFLAYMVVFITYSFDIF